MAQHRSHPHRPLLLGNERRHSAEAAEYSLSWQVLSHPRIHALRLLQSKYEFSWSDLSGPSRAKPFRVPLYASFHS